MLQHHLEKNTYAIYQLKHIKSTRDLRFEPFKKLQASSKTVDANNYDLVYVSGLPNEHTANLQQILDDLYFKFNIDHPADFTGHKHIEVVANTTKNKSSTRTLPLVPAFQELLLQKKEEQSLCRKLCGNAYCKDYLGYICVNELGKRLKPNTLSAGFKRILEENGLRIIRFHDLRHSCASLLLANGVSLKHIQEWLGHSDFSTTANFYAHLDFHSKLSSAEAMQTGLGMSAP